jgi:hypothetical protein
MNLTYTWEITGLKKTIHPSLQLDNVIIQTYWTVTGENEQGLKGVFNGATPFDLNQVDPDNFIPYENLTESQVIQWIQNEVNKHGDSYWEHINSRIIEQINTQIETVVNISQEQLPWKDNEINE